jgi:hypothetical protein
VISYSTALPELKTAIEVDHLQAELTKAIARIEAAEQRAVRAEAEANALTRVHTQPVPAPAMPIYQPNTEPHRGRLTGRGLMIVLKALAIAGACYIAFVACLIQVGTNHLNDPATDTPAEIVTDSGVGP